MEGEGEVHVNFVIEEKEDMRMVVSSQGSLSGYRFLGKLYGCVESVKAASPGL